MADSFESFCIVELFGHQKIVGKVTEQSIGGQAFVRVDVPATKRYPAFTRLFGSGAIYSITPVSEDIAIKAAEKIYVEPVTVYIEPSHQLVQGDGDGADEFESDDDDDDARSGFKSFDEV
jgi:hypothetical protein